MERVVHIAHSFREAEEWDIKQQGAMSPQQRQTAAKMLKDRVYGKHCPDIKEATRKQ